MEAISNRRSSDRRSSKQDDFADAEGDAAIASTLTTAPRERLVAAESPVASVESRSKGDTMSSEMADPGSPPLVSTTSHAPADLKTQAPRPPLLVRLPHCSIGRAEQCEVAFYRRLHSIPLKIERPVRVRLRVSEATAPLAAQFQRSPQPDRCLPKIRQRAETCATIHVRVRYLPPPRSEQLPSSLPQQVALARSPNISTPSPVQLRQSPPASSAMCRGVQDIPLIRCSTGCTRIPTGAENRSGGDRAERTPTTERVGRIPLPNQIRAETPGMHQTKPHPRSSPCASKRRRCRDARSVQDEDRGQGRLRIDRNSYLEVQDGPGSQRSGRTDRRRRK